MTNQSKFVIIFIILIMSCVILTCIYAHLHKTHKFGIEVHKSVAQAYALDENNDNTLWGDDITKYMKDVSHASRKLQNGVIVSIGY